MNLRNLGNPRRNRSKRIENLAHRTREDENQDGIGAPWRIYVTMAARKRWHRVAY